MYHVTDVFTLLYPSCGRMIESFHPSDTPGHEFCQKEPQVRRQTLSHRFCPYSAQTECLRMKPRPGVAKTQVISLILKGLVLYGTTLNRTLHFLARHDRRTLFTKKCCDNTWKAKESGWRLAFIGHYQLVNLAIEKLYDI